MSFVGQASVPALGHGIIQAYPSNCGRQRRRPYEVNLGEDIRETYGFLAFLRATGFVVLHGRPHPHFPQASAVSRLGKWAAFLRS
jgi:hypothetical protein